MSDLPPPPDGTPPPPPPPSPPLPPPPAFGAGAPPPPGYVPYGQEPLIARGAHAGFWIRFGAALLDGLVIGIPMAILGAAAGAYDSTSTDAFGNETDSTSFRFAFGWSPGAPFWFNVLNTVVSVAYFAGLEGGATGQTLGKRICGIRVVDATTGQPGIGTGRGVGRYFARYLSALPLLLGYFWMLWDDKRQTWHDKLVTSVVVKA